MQPIQLSEAAQALKARIVGEPGRPAIAVCTDTRLGAQGALFFALCGEKADGHQYVSRAFAGGAAGAVVERVVSGVDGPQLVVDNALEALGDLARYYRDGFDLPVIGVTGSVGKTSTREMIACALRSRVRVHTNERNFNNEIGVPLTLFGLNPAHEVVVLEMAMRGRGQIARLAEIARPTIGVVTNIGLSHIELLGSRDEIAAAKAELLAALPSDGMAVLNADDDYCARLRSVCPCPFLTFGIEHEADFRVTNVSFSAEGEPRFEVNGQAFALNTPGVHQAANAAAACAVASALGITLAEVSAQLERFEAPSMRMETLSAPGGVTVLNDAYNAAPDSMRAALDTLAVMGNGERRTVAVLGDMKELGEQSAEAHRYVGDMAGARDIGLVVAVGEEAEEIANAAARRLGAERVMRYGTTDEAAAEIRNLVAPGDAVLVKGSRAMELERVVEALVPKASRE